MPNRSFIKKVSRWKRIKGTALLILFLSVILGLIYPVFADGSRSIYPYANGLAIGILGGMSISFIELFLYYPIKHEFRFTWLLITKVLLYAGVFIILLLGVVMISRAIEFDYGFDLYIMATHEQFLHFVHEEDFPQLILYTVTFTFIIIFIKEIGRKLGPEILANFITGKYHRPKKEERIFLFIDLDGSTTLAEKLNETAYHLFISKFFKDITESIILTKGEIYQYVGDQVVVSWKKNTGLKKENCIYTYFYSLQALQSERNRYLTRFGIAPSFKAAMHCGEVIRGEVGDVKSEIVFHGDVVNTTSRIERLCSELNQPLLISENLIKFLPKYVTSQFISKGTFSLKGKGKKLEVFGLQNKGLTFLDSR